MENNHMELSGEWYHTELHHSELEALHRSPTIEYSFYNAVKTGDMEFVNQN
jgi:AraC family transcriptional regulator